MRLRAKETKLYRMARNYATSGVSFCLGHGCYFLAGMAVWSKWIISLRQIESARPKNAMEVIETARPMNAVVGGVHEVAPVLLRFRCSFYAYLTEESILCLLEAA
eukprot:TRINITY_DN11798_c0_g1_i2.p1 TRINITY_DN11798_c0_g1~~TRINITY_DN11798_c0_g1_i2.p1  ORF type:complete len:105 (-),score=6.02 TRINITY_DN11798_c0_g1_i2:239-553(-)